MEAWARGHILALVEADTRSRQRSVAACVGPTAQFAPASFGAAGGGESGLCYNGSDRALVPGDDGRLFGSTAAGERSHSR